MEYKLNKGAKHLTVLSKADAERMQRDGWGLWDEKQEKFIFIGDQKLNDALTEIEELKVQLAEAQEGKEEGSTEELESAKAEIEELKVQVSEKEKELEVASSQIDEVAKVLKSKDHAETMIKLSKVVEVAKKFAEQNAQNQVQGEEQ